MMTPFDAAREYHRRGWALVPVPSGQKAAVMSSWPGFRAATGDLPDLFGHDENIGVILGPASGGLVDNDLDCPEALALADLYLPRTLGVFGRPSKPGSHRLFVAVGATYESFADPITGKTLIELRAEGRDGGAHLTLFPPSVADGERREWDGEVIAPCVLNAAELRTAVVWLAIGCLVLRYVSETAARNPGPDLPDLLWETNHKLGRAAFGWLGVPAPDAPRKYPRPRREMSQAQLDLAELVHAIPNDADWETWNNMGLAIYAASAGSEHGAVVFDDWSAKSLKYNPYTTAERWRHYHRSPPSRTGIGKLVKLALEAGWRPAESAKARR